MTITHEPWSHFCREYSDFILPRADGSTDDNVLDKKDVGLVVIDILAQLHSISVPQEWNAERREFERMACLDYMLKAFDYPLYLLENTNVQVVVICMDPYGRRRVEKTATSDKRRKGKDSEMPAHVPVPLGQTEYFVDECPMPCENRYIFDDGEVKAEFYAYMTRTFQTSARFLSRIPPGKQLILSRGVRVMAEDGQRRTYDVVPPFATTSNSGWHYMTEHVNDNISEGDLDVIYWLIHVYPELNVHVHSYDADVLLNFLMAMRRVYKMNPLRKCWFVTRRSKGSVSMSDEQVKKRDESLKRRRATFCARLVETGSYEHACHAAGAAFDVSEEQSSSSSRKRSRTSVVEWTDYHIDISGVYCEIIAEANDRRSELGHDMCNPVESYVLALILSSKKHDYIQTDLFCPRVGGDFVWRAFVRDIGRFDDLVRVFEDATSSQDIQHREFFYEVDVDVLAEFVDKIYLLKGQKAAYAHKPRMSVVWKIAAQSSWMLQYIGNGVLFDCPLIDGTEETTSGESIYGFLRTGWADRVYMDTQTRKVSCPPLLR